MKTCTTCNVNKELGEFGKHKDMCDGHLNQCKSCRAEYMKNYSSRNADTISSRHRSYYEKNNERIKARVRNHWRENAISINEKRRERYKTDEEHRTKVLKQCSDSNRKCRPIRRRKNREEKTAAYYLELCRKRMWHAFNGRGRECKSKQLLGCDSETLRKHLESTKLPEKDYTNAHIDHIIPCAAFDMSNVEQQKECFHYTNLQLLPAEENLRKSSHF